MLDTVEIVEDAGQHAVAEIVHQVIKDLDAPLEDHPAQGEELLVRNAALLEPGCILRPAQREVGTDILPELSGKGTGSCIVKGGMQWMDGSDGTAIFSHGRLTGGSAYTKTMATKHVKPYLHIDLSKQDVLPAALDVLTWIDENGIKTLNVAGPRASKDPKIYKAVKNVLESLLILEASKERIFGSLRLSKTAQDDKIKKPETVEEAVERLMSEMNLRDLNKLTQMPEDDLVTLHFSLGMWIRNNFVYPRNDKLLQSCREVSKDKYLHWAQMHMVIIKELWKRLQETHRLKVV